MAKFSMDCKKIMVKEMSDRLNTQGMLIVTSYKGLSSQDMNELRKQLRGISDEYIVVKDSIAKRALAGGPNNRIAEFIEGEVGIVIDKKDDPIHVSKILAKFLKGHEAMKIHGGIMKGDIISKEDIAMLASLPSREVLLGKLANVLNAPIQGLAGALAAILSKILYALNAVKNQKAEDRGQKTENKAEGAEKKEQVPETTQKSEEKKQEASTEPQVTEKTEKETEDKG